MALPTTYSVGTATLTNGSATVTGQGTSWLTYGLQAGDVFWAAGMSCRILTVNSNTSITLAYNWPGSSQTAGTYEIRLTPEISRTLASARAVLELLLNGTVAALATAGSAASKIAYYTGSGVAALADITAHGRSFLGLTGGNGKFPRSTASGTIVMQDILGTVAQSSGVPTGALVERGTNANGEYARYADGTQMCWLRNTAIVAGVAYTWTYPAAFASTATTSVVATPASVTTPRCAAALASATSATANVWTVATGAEVSAGVSLLAMGRWFL